MMRDTRGAGSELAGYGTWRSRVVVSITALLTMASAALVGASGARADTYETVIVTASGSTSPATAVLNVGGTVLNQYTIINGVLASVTTTEAGLLAATPGIDVTPDITVSVQSTTVSTGPHTPSDAFLPQTGAPQTAQAGDTGQGVTVAVLDTGIDYLPDFAGRLVGGVDLSGEGNAFQDSYGHGTFVAGLIAGNGASSNGQYSGEAPGANLVSVKVAGASGSTDLGNLISGLQWTDNNRAAYNIRVLNISLGFQPSKSTVNNPLDMAVERVWNDGIAVVVSAGNAGPFNGTILSPGDDPLVITVGALDDMAQTNLANDEMTDFSSVGPTSPDGWVKPDLVTSGRSIVSLAAPGSTIYNNYPSARIGSANFVGSGTSFSAAITSGAAALVLANHAADSPDQVKAALLATANPGPVGNPFVDGHGALNAYGASTESSSVTYNQSTAGLPATPNGTTVSLSPTGSTVNTWNGQAWNGQAWNGQAWNGQAWNGYSWSGQAWNGQAWNGQAWNGQAWNGAEWNGQAWNGQAWNGQAWNGSSWTGQAWNGQAWNGQAWN
jgi:serine protease AprX